MLDNCERKPNHDEGSAPIRPHGGWPRTKPHRVPIDRSGTSAQVRPASPRASGGVPKNRAAAAPPQGTGKEAGSASIFLSLAARRPRSSAVVQAPCQSGYQLQDARPTCLRTRSVALRHHLCGGPLVLSVPLRCDDDVLTGPLRAEASAAGGLLLTLVRSPPPPSATTACRTAANNTEQCRANRTGHLTTTQADS